MTDIEKAKIVVKKAIERGWNQQLLEDEWDIHPSDFEGRLELCLSRPVDADASHLDLEAVIMDRDFCQALYGHKQHLQYLAGQVEVSHENWVWHIKAMSVAENRIEYLWENQT